MTDTVDQTKPPEDEADTALAARPETAVGAVAETPTLDESVLDDDLRRERKWGWIVAGAFFGVGMGFAIFAPLDSAVYAQGAIAVSGNRQAVQHRDGGIVSALKVREGQRVEAGDVLIELAPADVGAQAASLLSQLISLEAQRARLLAEYGGHAQIEPPAAFAELPEEARAEAEAALARQRTEMAARRATLARQKAVLNQRAAQLSSQIEGLRGQQAATEDQARLLAEELKGIRQLAERGFASQTQLRALERSEAGLEGQQAGLASSAAQARDQIAETRLQAAGLASDYIERVTRELREVETALADVKPRYIATKERLDGTAIRAPASGEIVGLNVFTVGGVIAPGQAVMEVVPDEAPLVVEAQISPTDADDIHVGQNTRVRVIALRDRNAPTLNGKVTRVSADRLVDQKTGLSYYTAQITVPSEEFARLRQIKGAEERLRAGLPVEVLVPLRRRTAFQYMVEPLTGVFWRSFREH